MPLPETPPPYLQQVLDLLACPACLQALAIEPGAVACTGCGRRYPVIDSIPVLLADRATRPLAQA